MSAVAHFFMSVGGSKIHERLAHFFIDIYSLYAEPYDGSCCNLRIEPLRCAAFCFAMAVTSWMGHQENRKNAFAFLPSYV